MSILYFIIFLFVSYHFKKNFERTLICYAPFKLIFHSGIYLVDSFIAVNLDLAISLVALLCYYRFQKFYLNVKIPSYLLFCWFVFCVGKFIYGSYFRFVPNEFFYEPVTSIAYGFMLFKVVQRDDQIVLLIKYFICVSLILFADAVVDVVLGINPIIEIEKFQAGSRFWVSSNTVMRAGMARTTSFMGHSIAMGTIAVFLWGILVLIYVKCHKYVYDHKLFLFCIAILPICMLFANSRTTMLMALCFLLLFVERKTIFDFQGVLVLLALLCVCFVANDYLDWIYNSIFHESSVDVQGSSSDLRERQWEVAFYYFMKSPIWGQGIDFDVLRYEEERNVMGMESLWFQLFMRQGLVGVISYCVFLLGGLVCFWKTNKAFCTFFVAWVVSITFSSQVSVSTFLYVVAILLSYKIKILNMKI